MDKETARRLCALNSRFYSENAASFGSTRHAPWPGWGCCLAETGMGSTAEQDVVISGSSCDGVESDVVRVLDVGCGNLRFEEYLAQAVPHVRIVAVALDNCDDLVPDLCAGTHVEKRSGSAVGSGTRASCNNTAFCVDDSHRWRAGEEATQTACSESLYPLNSKDLPADDSALEPQDVGALQVQFLHCDIAAMLDAESVLPVSGEKFDLAVAFGVFHHLPLPVWRTALVHQLIGATRSGGYVCLSLWRFLDDAGLAMKAQHTHEQGISDLGFDADFFADGDRLLGWRGTPGVYRYCHSFSDSEINELVVHLEKTVDLVKRFKADGRTGLLNEYLVLRVR